MVQVQTTFIHSHIRRASETNGRMRMERFVPLSPFSFRSFFSFLPCEIRRIFVKKCVQLVFASTFDVHFSIFRIGCFDCPTLFVCGCVTHSATIGLLKIP